MDGFVLKKRKRLSLDDQLKKFYLRVDYRTLFKEHSIRQKIGGKQSLKCVGKNPRLAQAKSRNDKNISGLLNQIEDNAKTGKIGIHTFTNASAHEIGQTKALLLQSTHFGF